MNLRISILKAATLGGLTVGCTPENNPVTPVAAFNCHVGNFARMLQVFQRPGSGDYYVRVRIFEGDTATSRASISPAADYAATRAGDVVTYWSKPTERYVGMVKKTEADGQEINLQTGKVKSFQRVDGVIVSAVTRETQCNYSPNGMKAERPSS